MVDIVSLRLNQSLVATTFDRDNQPPDRNDPFFTRNSALNRLNGILANRLSAQSVLIAQGAENGEKANDMLAKAASGLEDIEDLLDEMEDLAEQSEDDELSNIQRAILDVEFAALRDEIDATARRIEARKVFLLAGIASFTATGVGNKIDANDGFVGFTFASPTTGAVDDGDVLTVNFDSATGRFTVINGTTGQAEASEAVSTPPAGQTLDVPIHDLGLTITLDDTFNDGADITNQNTLTVSGTIADLGFDVQVGKDDQGEDQVPLDISASFVTVLSSGLRTADIRSAANATAALADLATAKDAFFDIKGKVLGTRERLGRAAEVGFNAAAFLNTSAQGSLFDPDPRLAANRRISEEFLRAVRTQIAEDTRKGEELLQSSAVDLFV